MKKMLPIATAAAVLLSAMTGIHHASAANTSSYITYKVQKGDTLTGIAKAYGISYQDIQRANFLTNASFIKVNQALRIPTEESIVVVPAGTTYVTYKVVKGDTLSSIAKRYGLTYNDLQLANGMGNSSILKINQVINIPSKVVTPAPVPAANTHTVVKGDTFYSIAKKYGVSVVALQKENNLTPASVLKLKQVLKIPKAVVVTPTVPTPTAKKPEKPSVTVTDVISPENVSAYAINGTAETNATIMVTIKDSKGKVVTAAANTTANNVFSTSLNLTALADGSLQVTVTQKNTQGLSSDAWTTTVSKDTTGPTTTHEELDQVIYNNETAYSIVGKTEANAQVTMTVKDESNAIVGKTVSSTNDGTFNETFDLSSLQNGNVSLSITAKDTLGNVGTTSQETVVKDDTYYIVNTGEREKWGISNKGDNSLATTNGFNTALKWANQNGIKTFDVPTGTYLIHKDNGIDLVSDITFYSHDDTVYRKETNGHEGYDVLFIGDVKNVTVRGGHFIGDRETHDYSGKDGDWSAGTHEWGHAILTKGAENILIEDVKLEKFTGDGMEVSGSTVTGSSLTNKVMELGGIDDNGNPIVQAGKMRTFGRTNTNFDHKVYQTYRSFYVWLPEGFTTNRFDVYFYRKDGSFISSQKQIKFYNGEVLIPDGADYYRLVGDGNDLATAKASPMVVDITRNLTIQDSDLGFNRRQGISLVGSDNIKILNNTIHDTGGVAPQSGIDIEPGFMPGTNTVIKGNTFENNKINTVLAYGSGVTIEDNHYGKGGIGLYVHPGFADVNIRNNTFNGSGLTTQSPGAIVKNNTFTNGELDVWGAGSVLDQTVVNNNKVSIGGLDTTVSNLTINQDGTYQYGSLYIGDERATYTNVTLNGVPKMGIINGFGHDENVYTNLVIANDKSVGVKLAKGTYNGCTVSGGINFDRTGKYVVNNCEITATTNLGSVSNLNGGPDVTIRHSRFRLTQNIGYGAAFYVTGVNTLNLLENTFTAKNMTSTGTPFIKLGPYGAPKATAIFNATLKGNTIELNNKTTAIDTTNAGTDAPVYTVDDNIIYNGLLKLKGTDTNQNNQLLTR